MLFNAKAFYYRILLPLRLQLQVCCCGKMLHKVFFMFWLLMFHVWIVLRVWPSLWPVLRILVAWTVSRFSACFHPAAAVGDLLDIFFFNMCNIQYLNLLYLDSVAGSCGMFLHLRTCSVIQSMFCPSIRLPIYPRMMLLRILWSAFRLFRFSSKGTLR